MRWREGEENAEEEEEKQRQVSDQTAMRRTTSRWCWSFLEGGDGAEGGGRGREGGGRKEGRETSSWLRRRHSEVRRARDSRRWYVIL